MRLKISAKSWPSRTVPTDRLSQHNVVYNGQHPVVSLLAAGSWYNFGDVLLYKGADGVFVPSTRWHHLSKPSWIKSCHFSRRKQGRGRCLISSSKCSMRTSWYENAVRITGFLWWGILRSSVVSHHKWPMMQSFDSVFVTSLIKRLHKGVDVLSLQWVQRYGNDIHRIQQQGM